MRVSLRFNCSFLRIVFTENVKGRTALRALVSLLWEP